MPTNIQGTAKCAQSHIFRCAFESSRSVFLKSHFASLPAIKPQWDTQWNMHMNILTHVDALRFIFIYWLCTLRGRVSVRFVRLGQRHQQFVWLKSYRLELERKLRARFSSRGGAQFCYDDNNASGLLEFGERAEAWVVFAVNANMCEHEMRVHTSAPLAKIL